LNTKLSNNNRLEVAQASFSETTLRVYIRVGIERLEACLSTSRCSPLYDLQTKVALTQLWGWVHKQRTRLQDGRTVTVPLVRQFIAEEMETILWEQGAERFARSRFPEATELFDALVLEQGECLCRELWTRFSQ
jgi:malate synthase